MCCAPKAFMSGLERRLFFFHSPFSVLLIYLRSDDRFRGEWKKIKGRSTQDINALGAFTKVYRESLQFETTISSTLSRYRYV